MHRRPSQRRAYDLEDLAKLCAADLDLALHPSSLSEEARAKLEYWLGRAWDSGHHGVPDHRPSRT